MAMNIEYNFDGASNFNGKVSYKNETIASANNLTLDPTCLVHILTGTTAINLIDNTGYSDGDIAILVIDDQSLPPSTHSINHNQAESGNYKPILLNAASAVSVFGITLIYHDSKWWQA